MGRVMMIPQAAEHGDEEHVFWRLNRTPFPAWPSPSCMTVGNLLKCLQLQNGENYNTVVLEGF